MLRRRSPQSPGVVYRTSRVGLRVTSAQRRRLVGLLVSAGDVWACVLELNAWRWARQDRPLVSYQELCRELAASGSGCFGELDSVGARSVLRRYSDAWFAAAKRRRDGDQQARFPRRRRSLMPVRYYHGTFTLDGQAGSDPGRPWLPAVVGAAGPAPALPARAGPVGHPALRRVAGCRCDVTAEVPVACLPARPRTGPGPGRRRGSGGHPPLRGRRTRRPGAAGVGAGDPRRASDAPGRHQSPPAGRSPAERPSPASAGRAGGGTTGAGNGWSRPGIGVGSARPCTRPPRR